MLLPTLLLHVFTILSLSYLRTSRVFAQQELSDTSGWALRANQTCAATESDCGPTANGFVGCCPGSSPCLTGYNNVCCPPNTNCTDTLIDVGPWCADPTWVLCDNNGYFCCLPGQTCYNDGNTDGCTYANDSIRPDQQILPQLPQVPRSAAVISSATTGGSSTPSSTSAAAQQPRNSSSSTTTSSQTSSGGLSISDKIAIGIGAPVGAATILGVLITWKIYQRKKDKDKNQPGVPSVSRVGGRWDGWSGEVSSIMPANTTRWWWRGEELPPNITPANAGWARGAQP